MIGFLAAVLVLAQLCDDEGLFTACGAWMARGATGRPRRLLASVFAVASVTTAVLSLDATIVLLTPVVFATAARVGARPRPHVYACTHLSNTASLLLPVSNLTNLLAFAASGLSFPRFAALMGLPWLVAIGTEYVVFRRFFATDLDADAQAPPAASSSTTPPAPSCWSGPNPAQRSHHPATAASPATPPVAPSRMPGQRSMVTPGARRTRARSGAAHICLADRAQPI